MDSSNFPFQNTPISINHPKKQIYKFRSFMSSIDFEVWQQENTIEIVQMNFTPSERFVYLNVIYIDKE